LKQSNADLLNVLLVCRLLIILFSSSSLYLGLEYLELRRLKYDLVKCFKMCHGDTDIEVNSLFMFQCNTVTRGHIYKLLKQPARVNAIENPVLLIEFCAVEGPSCICCVISKY